jgi:aryl-alcohol dehydrogenase-like predicted oxidoreductase
MSNPNITFINKNVPYICLGTAESEKDTIKDVSIENIIKYAINNGIKVIDTAPNYYDGKSEIWIGNAISDLPINLRDDLVLVTKAGQLSNPEIKSGIHNKLSTNQYWCFDVKYFEYSISRSLDRLNIEKIDCLLIHNPELVTTGLNFIHDFEFLISFLERKCNENIIGCWGISTWNGLFGIMPSKYSLQLYNLLAYLNNSYGSHHFKVLQVPFGMWNKNEFMHENQLISQNTNDVVSLSKAAKLFGVDLMLNSPFNGGLQIPAATFDSNLSPSQRLLLDLNKIDQSLRIIGMRSITSIDEAINLLSIKLDM